MKIGKLFVLLISVLFIGQAHAGAWDELKPYEVTDETPIIFSPKDNTLVLEDPSGLLTVEEVLKRKDEFKPAASMGPVDPRLHYWIMQKISSRLDIDKNLRLEGPWKSISTNVISADGTMVSLKQSGTISGYSFLSDIDPALPTSAKVASRESLFSLRRGESLILLSQSKAFAASTPAKYVLRMVDNERFLETRRFGLYVEGALLGILFALMIFGWYSYFVNKDRAGLFYGTWISFAFLQVFAFNSQDGFHFTEFIVNANDIYIGQASLSIFIFSIGGYGQVFFYFLFASAYLQIGKYYPKTQKIIYLLILYFALHFIVNHFVNHNIPVPLFWLGNAILPVIAFVMLYKAAFERYRQGMNIAMFWLIASIPYFIFRLIFISGLMGYPSVFSYFPESGISYLLQNTSVSQAIGLCAEALVMALAVVSRNTWIQKELAHSIASQKTLVENQNKVLEETVAERTKELAEQHQKLDETHQLVVGSVNYASRLQRGQLPRQMRIDGRFASFATIWEPRDTIGGDLYWLSSSQQSGPFVLAVADCTGHGVPGAMLSLLVSNSLERIYANDTAEDPATALMSLDHYVRTGLNQDRPDSESDDGCDAAVLRIDRDKQTIEFAGAKLGLFQVDTKGGVTRHQGARCSLGYQDAIEDKDKPVVQTIRYQSGDTFAIVTDGLTDQIGGNSSIKTSFGYRRIENILKTNCTSDADYIAYMLKNDFLAWQGSETRRDDLTAVVFRL
jgi:serine phosphatase RsbU (regulator of sigma subunit)